MTERYCAIRIGDPRRHEPYFKLDVNTRLPELFETREDAEKACPKQSSTKVVRVVLHDGPYKTKKE